MKTEITNKAELNTMIGTLSKDVTDLSEMLASFRSKMNRIENYDGIDMTTPARILISNLEKIEKNIKTDTNNIENFNQGVNTLDKNDFDL